MSRCSMKTRSSAANPEPAESRVSRADHPHRRTVRTVRKGPGHHLAQSAGRKCRGRAQRAGRPIPQIKGSPTQDEAEERPQAGDSHTPHPERHAKRGHAPRPRAVHLRRRRRASLHGETQPPHRPHQGIRERRHPRSGEPEGALRQPQPTRSTQGFWSAADQRKSETQCRGAALRSRSAGRRSLDDDLLEGLALAWPPVACGGVGVQK